MCLRFVFLLITRMTSSLRLSRREEAWKTAEILLLGHQLAVLQRQQPRRPNLDWADRALLATLLSVIAEARRHGLRLLVTPDMIPLWHRDIIRRRWAARSIRGRTGRPATRRNIRAMILRLARENSGRRDDGAMTQDAMIALLSAATRIGCRQMTPQHLNALHASVE
jgi:putative transposase